MAVLWPWRPPGWSAVCWMNNLTVQVEYAIWLVFQYCNSQSFYSEFKANLYINPLQYSSESETINTTLIAGIIWMRPCDFSLVIWKYWRRVTPSNRLYQFWLHKVLSTSQSAQGSKNMAEQTRIQAASTNPEHSNNYLYSVIYKW